MHFFVFYCWILFVFNDALMEIKYYLLTTIQFVESSFFIRIILHFFKPFVLLFFEIFLFVFPFLWQEFHTCTVYSIFSIWLNWCTVQDLKNFLVNTQSSLQSYPLIMKMRVLLAFFLFVPWFDILISYLCRPWLLNLFHSLFLLISFHRVYTDSFYYWSFGIPRPQRHTIEKHLPGTK